MIKVCELTLGLCLQIHKSPEVEKWDLETFFLIGSTLCEDFSKENFLSLPLPDLLSFIHKIQSVYYSGYSITPTQVYTTLYFLNSKSFGNLDYLLNCSIEDIRIMSDIFREHPPSF